MDQYYCVNNNPVPCVRIMNIKIVNGFQTQRHLDTILIQCVAQVGPINRVYICNNPRFTDARINDSTMAHIELVNHDNHERLRSMLTNYYFHGLQWSISLTYHLFHGLDIDYRPLSHPCSTCAQFSHDFYNHINQQPLQTRSMSNRIQPSITRSTSSSDSDTVYQPVRRKSYYPVNTIVDDLINLTASTPANNNEPLQSVIITCVSEIDQQTTSQLIEITMAQGDPQVNTAEINDPEQPTPTEEEDGDQQWVDMTSDEDQDQ